MNYITPFCIILIMACSDKNEQIPSKKVNNNIKRELQSKHLLINDNLYTDNKGNLYLKTHKQKYFETGKKIEVWIKTVYVETNNETLLDNKQLKDFVDKKTWKLDTSNGYWTEYIDKEYRYHHTHMADGGTISVIKR